jgi:hypothetical protein
MDEKMRKDLINQIEGYMPEAIMVLEGIANDSNADAKTRVRASRLLLTYRNELQKIQKAERR